MNNNALKGKAPKRGKTSTGKLPDNVGFPRGGGGVIRKLTAKELEAQKNGI